MSNKNSEQSRGEQAIELLGEALNLVPKEGRNGIAWLTRKWIQAVLYVIILPISLIVLVACSKMYWHMTGVVRWAPYFIPLITLLILGAPVISGSISIISGVLATPKDGKGRLRTGLFQYGAFIRVVILWAIITPIGILLIPIQDCPTAFWMFVPFSIGHELAYHSDWHNAPPDREFQRIIMRLMKWGMIVCIILPFIFAGVRIASDHGYNLPQEDRAAIEVRKARNGSEEIIMQRRTDCVANITQKVKDGVPLTKADEEAVNACNEKYVYNASTGVATPSADMWTYFAAMSGGLFALHIIGAILIAGGLGFTGYKLVKTGSGSSSISWGTIIMLSLLALGGYSYFYGMPTWLKGISARIPTSSVATTEAVPISPLPDHFMTAREARNWQAVITEPVEHPFVNKPLEVQFDAGFFAQMMNPGEITTLEVERAVMVSSPDGEYIFNNEQCGPLLKYDDNKDHVGCAGKWVKGSYSGTYESLLGKDTEQIFVLKSELLPIIVMRLHKIS